MVVRRVVTGRAEDGSSVLRSDGEPPRVIRLPSLPAFTGALVWSSDQPPDLSADLADITPQESSFVPPPGGTRLHVMHFPPDAVFATPGLDLDAVVREQLALMPRLADTFGPDGMHTTDTLDYAIVIRGEVDLELDHGVRTRLRAGDVVVQQGTRHAWRNPGDQPVTIAFVLIGATGRGVRRR